MATELAVPETSAQRPTTRYSSLSELSKPFLIDPSSRSYKHQYANIYFVRLVELRPIVEERANERWKNVRGRYHNMRGVCRQIADQHRRQAAATTSCPEPSTVTVVLYRRHDLSRHATEAKCFGGHGQRCKPPGMLYQLPKLTLDSTGSHHLRHGQSSTRPRMQSTLKTNRVVSA